MPPLRRVGPLLLCALVAARPAAAQEVKGIYTDESTHDLGELTGIDSLRGLAARGWVEAYYAFNFNRVRPAAANANQGLSAVRARDLTIEGRTFDVESESPRLSLAEIEAEKVPHRGGFGFKLDLAAGAAQDIIFDTIAASSPGGVRGLDRYVQHASLSYLAPLDGELRFDVGKFVTHIGAETIESVKNLDFSHSYFATFGSPVQDTGLRIHSRLSSQLYAEIYILQGWNVTFDNNHGKSFGASLGWAPSSRLSVTANYLGGPERNHDDRDRRDLLDVQITVAPSPALEVMLSLDLAQDANAASRGRPACWGGAALYLRGRIGDRFSPTLRIESYADPQGFTTGLAQHVQAYTFTGSCRVSSPRTVLKLLLQPEMRYDRSTALFFSDRGQFRSRRQQLTLELGLAAFF